MEVMIGGKRIELPQDEVDRLVEEYGIGPWAPKKGQTFWYIDEEGDIYDAPWTDWQPNRKMLAIGNVFKTQEEAEAHGDWLKAVAEIKGSSNFVPDWNNFDQEKWSVAYDHVDNDLETRNFYSAIALYRTKEEARRAIEDHKQAYLTYFGVKEGNDRYCEN